MGWPVLATYGLTEAASQVATQAFAEAHAGGSEVRPRALEGWALRVGGWDRLEIRGLPLHSFELQFDSLGDGEFSRRDPNAWHDTGDLGRLVDKGRLEILGRSDLAFKILGERVLLDELRRTFAEKCGSHSGSATLTALPDARRGYRILAVCETQSGLDVEEAVGCYNESVASFEQISATIQVGTIPRTPLGKIRETELRQLLS